MKQEQEEVQKRRKMTQNILCQTLSVSGLVSFPAAGLCSCAFFSAEGAPGPAAGGAAADSTFYTTQHRWQ